MKRRRYSVEQIVAILKQAKVGIPVAELIRQGGDVGADILSLEETLSPWTQTPSEFARQCAAQHELPACENRGNSP